MPVHAAREHAATEASARGGGNVRGRSPTGFALIGREASAPILTTEWAASFMHGFNNPDTVRASNMPRTGSSPLLAVRGLVPYGQNMVARQKRGLADSTTAHSEIRTSFMPSDKLCEQQVDQPAQKPTSQPYQAPPVPQPDHRDQLRFRTARPQRRTTGTNNRTIGRRESHYLQHWCA
jgi:hypothetical protein